MTQETLVKLETGIRSAKLDEPTRAELLGLLEQLKSDAGLPVDGKLLTLRHSVEDLRSSVQDFEHSHPKLVQAVNGISSTLSSLGI
ncbi:MAG TPA: DUF4404 family protein [Verrucomicrobiae bacterium]